MGLEIVQNEPNPLYTGQYIETASVVRKIYLWIIGGVMKITPLQAKALGDKLGVDWNTIKLTQFIMGIEEEASEHADVIQGNMVTAAKLVLAHLNKNSKYYTMLRKLERNI
jgi:hypothetical protein